ncbi:MAG: 2-deoxy-5-keto-D-gluconate 6-phosphate aldolase domain-containing protein [Mycobacterium sp.]
MELGYPHNLYLLAFDHRGSFKKGLFGVEERPTDAEVAKIIDAKAVIFEGFLQALAEGVPPGESGILVDEQFGTEVAHKASAREAILAMPVEKSGQDEFDFEYGEDFGAHIEAFDPTFAKVLVRYNPDSDADVNARQARRLGRLSDWLHERGRRFLFELLVPPTPSELASVGGATGTYDDNVRPDLMLRTITALREAGVEPDIWKIEGLDRGADCERISVEARSGGRDNVACIVLGRGADEAKVDEWLRVGARVDGFRGFAIGRTLWWDALVAYRDGAIDRREAASRIAAAYMRSIDTYKGS